MQRLYERHESKNQQQWVSLLHFQLQLHFWFLQIQTADEFTILSQLKADETIMYKLPRVTKSAEDSELEP